MSYTSSGLILFLFFYLFVYFTSISRKRKSCKLWPQFSKDVRSDPWAYVLATSYIFIIILSHSLFHLIIHLLYTMPFCKYFYEVLYRRHIIKHMHMCALTSGTMKWLKWKNHTLVSKGRSTPQEVGYNHKYSHITQHLSNYRIWNHFENP